MLPSRALVSTVTVLALLAVWGGLLFYGESALAWAAFATGFGVWSLASPLSLNSKIAIGAGLGLLLGGLMPE